MTLRKHTGPRSFGTRRAPRALSAGPRPGHRRATPAPLPRQAVQPLVALPEHRAGPGAGAARQPPATHPLILEKGFMGAAIAHGSVGSEVYSVWVRGGAGGREGWGTSRGW